MVNPIPILLKTGSVENMDVRDLYLILVIACSDLKRIISIEVIQYFIFVNIT